MNEKILENITEQVKLLTDYSGQMNDRILKILGNITKQTRLLTEYTQQLNERLTKLEKSKIELTGGEVYKIKN